MQVGKERVFTSNVPGCQIEVVAVVDYNPDGTIREWAAYIGVTKKDSEYDTKNIAEHGAKLYKKEAVALTGGWFPPEKHRR
jgi:hypothetical protein